MASDPAVGASRRQSPRRAPDAPARRAERVEGGRRGRVAVRLGRAAGQGCAHPPRDTARRPGRAMPAPTAGCAIGTNARHRKRGGASRASLELHDRRPSLLRRGLRSCSGSWCATAGGRTTTRFARSERLLNAWWATSRPPRPSKCLKAGRGAPPPASLGEAKRAGESRGRCSQSRLQRYVCRSGGRCGLPISWIPHSVLSCPAHRPERGSLGSIGFWVWSAQPIEV